MDVYPPDFSYTQQIIAESRVAALHEETSRLKERIKVLEKQVKDLKHVLLTGHLL
jgi:cell division protein FtsB